MENTLKKYKEKYQKAYNRYIKTLKKNNPLNVTSTFITCRNCGSKINREKLERFFNPTRRLCCPICLDDTGVYSKTANERINKADENRRKTEEDYMEMSRKYEEKEQEKDFKSALEETRNYFDFLYEEIKTPDYVQIRGNIGGDVSTYRVYNDGSVYAK